MRAATLPCIMWGCSDIGIHHVNTVLCQLTFVDLGVQARNLMKAGYTVTVWNRSPDKCKELELGEGASVAGSSADCVAASDITIAMLADPAAALAVARDAAKGLAGGEEQLQSLPDPY